ncbi:hypothetical protein [Massilia luteola]|uniref:hypothetical protein n=1 Tax=Massilia luteola TaxID=3081751 RepID=UPI002ACC0EA4|nr:hypothetical protein [Massilia sp. Gc5]
MNKTHLTARRAALIEQCAGQRVGLAYELDALRPSKALAGNPLAGYVAANRKLVLGAAGAVLGLVLMRRKRLAGVATSALSVWKMARGALGVVAQLRR